MARARRAANADSATSTNTTARPALREKSSNSVQQRKAPIYDDDGNTDGLIKNKKIRGKKVEEAPQETADAFCMTGAVANGDAIQEHGTGSSQDGVMDESAKSDVPRPVTNRTTQRPPRFTRKPIETADPLNVLQGLQKRMLETAQREAGKQETPSRGRAQTKSTARISGGVISDIEDSPSPSPDARQPGSRLSMRVPGSALRVPSTPGADLSTIALRHFKPRPRQGSMLQIMQQRAASARPSAVLPQEVDESTAGFDLGAATDEEEFQPEAEGTPLVRSKQLKRAREDDFSSTSATSRLRAKKRKSAGDVTVASQSRVSTERLDEASPVSSGASSIRIQVRRSVEVDEQPRAHSSGDEDLVIPSTGPEVAVNGAPLDGTMADPLSSSPLPSSSQRKSTATAREPIPAAARKGRKQKTQVPSTADLQSMLPKRRTRAKPRPRRNVYDMISEDDADSIVLDVEEDELAGSSTRTARRKTPTAQASRKNPAAKARKPSVVPSRKSTAARREKTPVTYGRKKASDKENNDYEICGQDDDSTLPEEAEEVHEISKSKELEAARQKFAAIDDWDLSFESVSHDSSETWR